MANSLSSPAKLELRDYQLKLKQDLYQKIREGGRKILIVAGTGLGKTETAASIVQDILGKGRRAAFIVHRNELVKQTITRFNKYGLNPSAVCAGYPEKYDNPCQVVSIQSLARRPDAMHVLEDIALYDEAHITAFSTLGKDLLIHNRSAIAIGLTATPWRLSKREQMGDLFSALVCAPLPHEVIKMGFLVPPKYYGLSGIDTSSVKTVAGDFSPSELGILTDDPEVVKVAVDEWQRLGQQRKTIAFTVNVAHSKALVAEFNKRNIPFAHLDGSMSKKELDPIFDDLRNNRIIGVSSCEKLSEGFDMPDISCAMLCRPTKSKAKYVQQLGRALRIFPGKTDAIILDQAGNVPRHGFIEDLSESDFQLTLSGDKQKGEPPIKECPNCTSLIHISLMVCPECEYKFPEKDKIVPIQKLEDLRPAVPEEATMPIDLIEYRQWKRDAFAKGIAPGYAMAKYKERYGDRWPGKDANLGALFQGKATKWQATKFYEYLRSSADKKSKDDDWLAKEWKKEFGWAKPYPDAPSLQELAEKEEGLDLFALMVQSAQGS